MVKMSSNCEINLEKLIATRMLINANSGGGKSWAIRRFLEQSQGQVQQIILDLEGEFISLREEYDYLLVGKEGEIPVSIRTAELLAKKLLELNVSTVIDLSELKHSERITFVKRFLDSLVNAPKNLWHPVIVVVDEAHQFCPEKSKSESMSSVIDLMTRGRKRGFCGVLATQRISKLHKDAAAECNNQMIGRTGLDIDMKRAGDILGFTSKEDIRSLRNLKAGEFYVYGSAFGHDGIEKIKVGDVKTTHPDRTRGILVMESSPTPENIKKIMKSVINLPKEAEEEIRTTEDMKKKIRELKTKLTIAEKSKIIEQKITEKLVNITDDKALQKAKNEGFKEAERFYKSYINPIEQNTKKLRGSILRLVKNSQNLLESKAFTIVGDFPIYSPTPVKVKSNIHTDGNRGFKSHQDASSVEKRFISPSKVGRDSTSLAPVGVVRGDSQPKNINAGAMRMLKAAAMFYPNEVSRAKIGAIAGMSYKSGTFSTYLTTLKRESLIVGQGNSFSITDNGLEVAGDVEQIPTDPEGLVSLWEGIVKGGASRMLRVLFDNYPNSLSREELGDYAEISSTSGTFSTYLTTLKRNGLIKVEGQEIKISEEFF